MCLSPEVLSIPLSPFITCELLGFICIFIASITVAVWPFLKSGSEPRTFNLAELSLSNRFWNCLSLLYVGNNIIWFLIIIIRQLCWLIIEEIKSIKSSTTKTRHKERNRIWTIFVTTVNISWSQIIRLESIITHAVIHSFFLLFLSCKMQIDLLYQSENSYSSKLWGVADRG